MMSIITGCSDKTSKVGEYDSFAKCLTEKKLTMYGTEWCSHCKNQKKEFGSSFQYVNYVDCDKSSNKCAAAGVRRYPTWEFNGTLYPGEQALYKLATLSGCELK